MSERWRPLSARADPDEAEGYDALSPGVPDWLTSSLQEWLHSRLGSKPDMHDFLLRLERVCRTPLDWRRSRASAIDSLDRLAWANVDGYLDAIDFVLAHEHPQDHGPDELSRILEEGGSLYRVALREGTMMLERRVAREVAEVADHAIATGGRAGEHLGRAWRDVYGRDPSPSSAYREAVRAVESAAKPIIEPANARATLGTMIRVVENSPQQFALPLHPATGNPVDDLIAMMRVLWTSQLDRHGTDDESVPIQVSPEEAEAAVHLAATLVHWFNSGAVTRI